VVQIKQAMIQCAAQTAVLTISEKINSFQRLKICPVDEVNFLITELDEEDSIFEPFLQEGLKVL
jgi:DeoR/GlpR family transcriptional regulator of sugar metabolism